MTSSKLSQGERVVTQRLAGRAVALLAAFLLLSLYLSLYRDALIDDAFIAFQYARNLREHLHWGFFPVATGNTATSPLNVLLLALAGWVFGDVKTGVTYLTALEYLGLLLVLRTLSRRLWGRAAYGYIPFAMLLFHPWLNSTIGLEGILFTCLFLLSLACMCAQRWHAAAAAFALLTLARFDGLLFLPVLLTVVPGARKKLHCAALYATCLAPWLLFSWIRLGSFIPDTFFIKTAQDWHQGYQFWDGLGYYLGIAPVATLASFSPLLLLAFGKSGDRCSECRRIVLIMGSLHFLSYSFLKVPPYHWYYVPLAITCVTAGTMSLIERLAAAAGRKRQALWALAVACVGTCAAPLLLAMAGDGLTLREMPIHSNVGTAAQYRQAGLWLNQNLEPDATVVLHNVEIGTLAYYSRRFLLNEFSDRRSLFVHYHNILTSADSWVKRTLLALNFRFLQLDNRFAPSTYRMATFLDNGDLKGSTPPGIETFWRLSSTASPPSFLVFGQTNPIDLSWEWDIPHGSLLVESLKRGPASR